MKVGDLVKLDPDSSTMNDMYKDDPIEWYEELKWIGVVTETDTDYNDHAEIVVVHWSHKTHSCPEYVNYLMVVEQPDKNCP